MKGRAHPSPFASLSFLDSKKVHTVDSRYLDFGYLEQPVISKRKSGPCLNRTSGNKILWIRGEIAPQEQFLLLPTIFLVYICN